MGTRTRDRCRARSTDGCFGRVQRKPEEGEPAHSRQRRSPGPARSSVRRTICPRDQRQRRLECRRSGGRSANRRMHKAGASGRFELSPCTETGSAAWQRRGHESRGEFAHEDDVSCRRRRRAPDEERPRFSAAVQQGRHLALSFQREGDRLRRRGVHPSSMHQPAARGACCRCYPTSRRLT